MRSLNSILDLSVEELDELIATAKDIAAHPEKYRDSCKYKKLATLFYEPSTRTRLSFEAAMLELGGSVLGFSSANSSSAAKGESMADTAKIISCYADIMAIRHPKDGAPFVASRNASVPVINAGDGMHNHPTQTLADLLTISREMGRLNGLTVGLCGDLKYGRTVHSLIEAMCRYENIRFVLISPEELKLPGYVKYDVLEKSGFPYEEVTSLEEAMPKLDVLYMTRIQRERFSDPAVYERLKDSYILDTEKMKLAKEKMCVLHPLPRVNEISVAVDDDPRAAYFRQALNGKFMRMALILKLLKQAQENPAREPIRGELRYDLVCRAQAHPLSPGHVRFIRIVSFQVLHSPAVSASLQSGPGAVSNAAGSIEHAVGLELAHLAFIVDFSHDLPVKAAQYQPWQIAGAFQFHHQLLKPIAVHIQLCIPGRLRRFLCAHPLCQYPAEFRHGVRIVRICKIPVVKPDPVPQDHSLPVLCIRHCAGLRRHGLAGFFRGLLCCKVLQAEITRPQDQHKHGSHGKNLQCGHHRPLFPDDSQPPLPEGIRLLDIAALHTAEHFQKLQFRHLRPSFSRYVSSLPRMR